MKLSWGGYMSFLVGYQLTENDLFINEIIKQKDKISEIYFSYGNLPNGRHTALVHENLTTYESARRTDDDLSLLAKKGFKFNLLLNGNCYGDKSLSRGFLTSVCDMIDEIASRFGLASITTTSPVLADVIKANFSEFEVRASVNMEIATIEGMEYLADKFDGFYIARELNRDINRIKELRNWCLNNGKKTYILANSGCLSHCSARQFHDNLVAHENQIALMDNVVKFDGICGAFLKNAEDKSMYFKRLNFIRPEDLSIYDGLSDGIKLATRVNKNPAQVLRAYADQNYAGNLLELLEPNHARHLYPLVLENKSVPVGYGEKVSKCAQKCMEKNCNYCGEILNKVLKQLPDVYFFENQKDCDNCNK